MRHYTQKRIPADKEEEGIFILDNLFEILFDKSN